MTKTLRHEDLVVQKATNFALLKAIAPHMWPSIPGVDCYKKTQLACQPQPGSVFRFLQPFFGFATESKAPAVVMFFTVLIAGMLSMSVFKEYRAWGDHSPVIESLIYITCAIGWYLYRFECEGPKMWMSSRLKLDGGFFNYQAGKYDFVPAYVVSLLKVINSVLPDSNFMISYIGDDPVIYCEIDGEIFVPLIFDKDGIVSPPV